MSANSSRLSHLVRRKFINYFAEKHGHMFVPSSSVKPATEDRSISFTNAGMNQFKNLFLSTNSSFNPSRVCNYQKCIRVGGKMCDLDAVGCDLRHHTFFEMLGNWSFNDYGKHEACEWALDFLVNHLNLEQEKIKVTYFSSENDTDSETEKIWLNLGLQPSQISANQKGDNFWDMGTAGPCGMSTEIFYPSGNELIELWNIVFIDRQRIEGTNEIVPLKNTRRRPFQI